MRYAETRSTGRNREANAPMKRFRGRRLGGAIFLMAALGSNLSGNTATQPVPREVFGGNNLSWMQRHEEFVATAKRGGIDVLFIGDSITDLWRSTGRVPWEAHLAPLRAANFGLDGDRTQHQLWRLQHGEIDGLTPRVVVVLIGTNNTGLEKDGTPRNTTAEAIEGITLVVRTLRTKLPATRILLLGLFPRGEKESPQRAQISEINAALQRLHDGAHIHFLDLGPRFLAPDGSIPRELMPDLVHPSEAGYAIWAAAIKPLLAEFSRPVRP
jgi:lysophospholipase L1-like esterase